MGPLLKCAANTLPIGLLVGLTAGLLPRTGAAEPLALHVSKQGNDTWTGRSAEPKPPYLPDNCERAKQVPIAAEMLSKNWKELPPDDELHKRFASKMDTIWHTDTPGATLTFKFRGTAASIYDLMGPDTGRAKITLDGKDIGVRQQVDPWSYYQRQASIPIASGLEDTVHEVMVELLPDPPDRNVAIAEAKKSNRYDPNLFEGVAFRFAAIRLIGELVE